MQRLRDQSLYERLQQSDSKNDRSSNPPQSFLPDLDDGKPWLFYILQNTSQGVKSLYITVMTVLFSTGVMNS